MVLFGGAFSATTGTGVGATVITLVYDKTVEANVHLHTETVSDVHGSVNVTANTKDLVALVSVNFGVSNGTAANVGGNVLIFQDTVRAQLSGKLLATRNVTIRGDSLGDLINAVASVSGSLANAAVSGAALVTYFKGITQAFLGEGSGITCADLKVMAASTANINSDTVGLTATFGSAAVSGLVNIIVTNSQTIASIGSGSSVNAADIQVLAADNYDLLAIAASLSGGSNGIGVTAVVTVAKNTVLAYIGDNTSLNSQNLTVQAISNRNIRNYAGSIAAGATAGVGATVMVAVIGGKLDQDSANAIAKGFQPDTFVNGISENSSNPAKAYLAEIRLSSDLASDETKASGLNVGNGGKYTGTDGYRSDEFNKQYKPGTNPGEYISDDITNTDGSELGLGKPQGDYKNVINAYIGKNC
ncbi:MAG: hypothetical protein Q4C03_06970, partial [bacterium]|nr:hypothetical protein [bacterium]